MYRDRGWPALAQIVRVTESEAPAAGPIGRRGRERVGTRGRGLGSRHQQLDRLDVDDDGTAISP